MASHISPELAAIHARAADVYRPSAPIDQRKLFAGRIKQLADLVDALQLRGQHAVVYGERGVGKTSLVSILTWVEWRGPKSIAPTVRHNCHRTDTFSRLWRRALDGVRQEVERPRIGFSSDVRREVVSLAEHVSPDPTPDEVVEALRRLETPAVFVFDEFDQVEDRKVADTFAEVMKALSDHAVASKMVIVGVGDTLDSLIESHASIERAVRQIHMPRMQMHELEEILDKANSELGMKCDHAAKLRIVRLSQGLPHYVHSLGLQSVRRAVAAGTRSITMKELNAGVAEALNHASRSLLDSYVKATSSPQKDSLYKSVLLACALARTDELSCFAPAAVREPLRAIGQDLEIPAFASHLNKFASADRGNVLRKTGQARRYRYRFSNPLLQPYVVMRGIADKLVDADTADELLNTKLESDRMSGK